MATKKKSADYRVEPTTTKRARPRTRRYYLMAVNTDGSREHAFTNSVLRSALLADAADMRKGLAGQRGVRRYVVRPARPGGGIPFSKGFVASKDDPFTAYPSVTRGSRSRRRHLHAKK